MSKKVLNVLYQSDDNYAMVSGISITSLLENNQHLDAINIYYLNYLLQQDSINKLMQIAKQYSNCSLQLIDAGTYHEAFKEMGVRPWRGLYVTWLKLLAFADLKLETDRVLFINGHTIINGRLDELIDTDFEGNAMALSYDCLLNEHKRTIGLQPTDGYYNCGIMLINHKKWLDDNTDTKIRQHLAEKNDYVIADQDFCNVFFKDSIKPLDVTYNFSSAYYAYNLKRLLRLTKLKPPYFYSYAEIMENYYDPKIVHSLFGLVGKPWEAGSAHPNHYLWNKYIKLTPWKNAVKPGVKRSHLWYMYKLLPSFIFMPLYRIGMYRLYAKQQ